ncbi:MAG: hypothetical protein C5B57_02990 [Blastocatellia bacterium]|nr:MAG: hypothetical protein C5B57_02990 [Blastocatellia bacterium]
MKIWISIAAMLMATDATAQTVILSGGYFRDIKRFSGDPEMNVLNTDANGLQLGVGTLVVPRVLVTLEFGRSEETSVSRTTSISYLGQPVDIRTLYANRLTTWSALFGLRTAATQRIQLTYLGGVAFFHVSRRITSESQAVFLPSPPPPTSSFTVDNVAGPTVGIDAGIKATDHFAIVFAMRVQALRISADLAGISMRPGVEAQFSF